MPFERPNTIKEALDSIHQHGYVLPAIQREFVWQADQITRLFDSLMRGYPMGSFLLWKVEAATTKRFKFYDFVRDYHQRDAPHCPQMDLMGTHDVIAVLDGQQRLTALNIGFRGSYARKEPRKHWSNSDAFPVTRLYLNLLAEDPGGDDDLKYDFRFLTDARANQRTEQEFWFPVKQILELEDGPDLYEYLAKHALHVHTRVYRTLDRLHKMVHVDQPITPFVERAQDLDKVLNIFIRVNSGGTPLSYSDLLLSVATASWKTLDARRAIYDLVDGLNATRNGFSFSKDFVLKAGLMLCDIASVGFKVANFDAENMAVLEGSWEAVEAALRIATELVADMGFDARTLTADSVLLPLAYYAKHRALGTNYLTATRHREDRNLVKSFVVRSILKPGIWGSGLDTTLTALRKVIKEHGAERFPLAELEAEMARLGRSLRFEEEEVQDLADSAYGERQTFALLSLLFPHVDLRNQFHVDHVFPQARFRRPSLLKAGVPDDLVATFQTNRDALANLQLLDGTQNVEKKDKLPSDWLAAQFPAPDHRAAYQQLHDLGDVPQDVAKFMEFFSARRERLLTRLRRLLGTTMDSVG